MSEPEVKYGYGWTEGNEFYIYLERGKASILVTHDKDPENLTWLIENLGAAVAQVVTINTDKIIDHIVAREAAELDAVLEKVTEDEL